MTSSTGSDSENTQDLAGTQILRVLAGVVDRRYCLRGLPPLQGGLNQVCQ
jgi:hypothetical protein